MQYKSQARARLLEASKADEQGWMTVVNTGTEMKAVSENPAYEKKKQLKAQKTQEVETIYRFQRREIQKESMILSARVRWISCSCRDRRAEA
jgi:CMP-N-acetylneuraminic acid synthetase